MRLSACCISSMDSLYSYSASSLMPQSLYILECRKYWLIAVNSLRSTRFRMAMISSLPFM